MGGREGGREREASCWPVLSLAGLLSADSEPRAEIACPHLPGMARRMWSGEERGNKTHLELGTLLLHPWRDLKGEVWAKEPKDVRC